MSKFFRILIVFSFASLFIALGSVCRLGSDGNVSITHDPTPTSPSFRQPSPTPTSTPDQSVILQVTSSPAGALVELNPQEGDRGYVPGTGRAVGSTPLEIHLTPSDLHYSQDSCYSFGVDMGLPGYYSAYKGIQSCRTNGVFTFQATLVPCPADNPQHCGGF